MRFNPLNLLKSTIALVALELLTSFAAAAQETCSDDALKDFFIQGGQQVIEDHHLIIKSLANDEEVSRSDKSITCRYLMELSDHSRRWVRFQYSVDTSGQPEIAYEEEAKSSSR
jgi:hypothetical protein